MMDESSLGMFLAPIPPVASAVKAPSAYRVLARKYRPSNFDDLIGQEPMVRTLTNAFATGRIHQAYILTGVRGVGKTTTARILARALNYEIPGKINSPTIDMPELGIHCQAIIESRHVDIIEMDAASHTGIDDVRDIIESARYRPVSARIKVYIIDEVHMLSKQAFNGLLKTLEEPPEHVKFLFATTEIDKVPITVRSRCQRFDLRRVEPETLIPHLSKICVKEDISIESGALALIARAAEGSVRDSLSLLDQAIAHGANSLVTAESVRAMLGLADRSRIIDLFENVMKGNCASALNSLKSQYDLGADPAQVITEFAEFVHFVTRLQIVPEAANAPSLSPEERERGGHFAKALSLPILTRAWQMLLKGIAEIKDSNRPLAAAEMLLVRMCYAADLPTPDRLQRRFLEVDRAIAQGETQVSSPESSAARTQLRSVTSIAPTYLNQAVAPVQNVLASENPIEINTLEALVALAEAKRDIQMKSALECDVRLVRFESGRLEFELGPQGMPTLAGNLSKKLQEWTGKRWIVALSSQKGAPSLREQVEAKSKSETSNIHSHPLVKQALEYFKGSKIVEVRQLGGMTPAIIPESVVLSQDDDIAFLDQTILDDDL